MWAGSLWTPLLGKRGAACSCRETLWQLARRTALTALPTHLSQPCSEELKGYLSTRFTLRSGDRPHLMKF